MRHTKQSQRCNLSFHPPGQPNKVTTAVAPMEEGGPEITSRWVSDEPCLRHKAALWHLLSKHGSGPPSFVAASPLVPGQAPHPQCQQQYLALAFEWLQYIARSR